MPARGIVAAWPVEGRRSLPRYGRLAFIPNVQVVTAFVEMSPLHLREVRDGGVTLNFMSNANSSSSSYQ